MLRSHWIVGTGLVLAAASAGALAHVRMQHPSNQNKLFWSNPGSISVVIQSAGSADIPDGSHRTALRNAIQAWNALPGSAARLVENASPAQQARTDWESHDIHLLIFDEDDSSGFFPLGSSTVAVTPVWFFNTGAIVDADVIFNGRSFSFTTSGEPGRFDVQDVAAHELGHLLGLDHSGWAGATMYPYVDTTVILHRSLSDDELRGMRDAYPAGTFGVLRGRVRRASDSSNVAGAHVVARDAQGRPRAAGLTSVAGTFVLRGLDPGTYEVYAQPLAQPVGAANLIEGWTVHTDFAYTILATQALAAEQDLDLGDLAVEPAVAVDLGRPADILPLRAISDGVARSRTLRGAGLVAGSTLVASDPAVTVTPTAWSGTQVTFALSVPQGTPVGHVDLVVTAPGGAAAVLPAALELTPPDPIVLLVSPNQGSRTGGTAVSVTGANFHPGARVVIGGSIYVDGDGATVLSGSSIELTTLPSEPGILDVVVIDPSGVEGRAVGGYQFLSAPSISVVFPPAGAAAGGSAVTLSGGGFLPGLEVSIDGVLQPDVVVESSTRVTFETLPGTAGGPYLLELTNPDGMGAQAAFVYAPGPDPLLQEVAPAAGPSAGGVSVTLGGQALGEGHEVWFGVDPATGLGGVRAPQVEFLGPGALRVLLPARAPGTVAVLVRDPATGQASALPAAFTYQAPSGGGGGGCSALPVDAPIDRGQALRSALALLLLALALRAVGRPAPAGVRATVGAQR